MANSQTPSKPDRLLARAAVVYHQGHYTQAIAEAAKILKKYPGHLKTTLLMADIYHDLDSLSDEILWLKKAAGTEEAPALVFFRLGEALYKSGQYPEALEVLTGTGPEELPAAIRPKATRLRNNCAFAVKAMATPVHFHPENAGQAINSLNDEYWPSLTIDGKTLVFTRLLPVNGHPANRQEDFYVSKRDTAGFLPAIPLKELNSPMNEGAQTISADGNLLFFTLCNHPGGFGSCDLWYSRMENGKWSAPQNAGEPVNTSGWEGQPSWSAFGDELYFASARSGGLGNKDLWKAKLKGWDTDGFPEWEAPVNLGDSINTAGEEISPFIHPNGKDLYFSSDSWPGFGGLDLFHSEKKGDNGWSNAENLGYPVNSPGNEQGLVIDRTGLRAWFATSLNRKGNMDIYSFEADKQFRPEPVTFVRGTVVNAKTGQPVKALVEVQGTDPRHPVNLQVRADEEGVFLITLPPGQDISFSVNEKGYLFYSERFRFSDSSSALEPFERQLALVPAEPGKSIDLYQIFYATNAYQILAESEPELMTLLSFLNDNPFLKVEIGGHTDNTGTGEFNLQLSGKRAESVRQYLLDKGIDPERLSSKGYGMERPVAANETEEGRSLNRRTTITITK